MQSNCEAVTTWAHRSPLSPNRTEEAVTLVSLTQSGRTLFFESWPKSLTLLLKGPFSLYDCCLQASSLSLNLASLPLGCHNVYVYIHIYVGL